MNIAGTNVNMPSMNLNEGIGLSLLKKSLDGAEEKGAGLINMMKSMEASVQPYLGQNFDERV
ncbi:motility protein [Sporanaerobium hydrogeniformans]|uniref:Motility protein n=1 Tax=Sporanaerobium hydrogeniformans TaxID=3072179 RepID=A0AC61DGD9_9FIRM|nr:YjfB family protein [Sporanaerobium hydrogeniformans]PHV71930.1 motility protein [Sporanaerobium hydrogeniformans]